MEMMVGEKEKQQTNRRSEDEASERRWDTHGSIQRG